MGSRFMGDVRVFCIGQTTGMPHGPDPVSGTSPGKVQPLPAGNRGLELVKCKKTARQTFPLSPVAVQISVTRLPLVAVLGQ